MAGISLISSLIASIILIFMAIFIMVKDWRDQLSRDYALWCISGFGIIFTMFLIYAFPDSNHLTQINRITQISAIFTFIGVFILSLIFPKADKKFPFKYFILTSFPGVIISLIIYFTDYSILKAYFLDGVFTRDYGWFYKVYAAIAFTYLLTGTFNFLRKYLKTKVYIYKLQMRYLFLGASVAFIVAGFFSIILPLVYGYTELYVIGPSIAALIVTFSLFYSIIAHDLMDISTAIHKTSFYFIISTLIFLPIFGIIFVSNSNIKFFNQIPEYIVASSVVLVFIFFSIYLQPIIDKVFRRKEFEFDKIIDKFIIEADEINDFDNIIKKIINTLYNALNLRRVFFISLNEKERLYELYYLIGKEDREVKPVKTDSTFVRWFVKNPELLSRGRIYIDDNNFQIIRDDMIKFYLENSIVNVFPVYYDRKITGFICLGLKDSLSEYTPEEIDKLKTFQNQCNRIISAKITNEKILHNQLVERTIELSTDILSNSVSDTLPYLKGIKFGGFIIPRYNEGIDYYDFLHPWKYGVGAIATDVSGIGVDNALNSVVLRSSFYASIADAPKTNSVMKILNNAIFNFSKGKGALVTASYFFYNTESKRLFYTNAGFPPIEIYRVDRGGFDSLDTEGIPLGVKLDASFGMGRTNMVRDDIGILFSRSLINSKDIKGEEFGLTRLRSIIRENRTRRPEEISIKIESGFNKFLGISPPSSDLYALVFKIA
jgi:serine phosphatase RsbU (regulator of sigma subunit)